MKGSLLVNTIVALALCLASLVTLAQQANKKATYNGYLMDKMCSGEIMESSDSMAAAKEHTKDCALMKSCIASGYGIVSGGKFYAFDAHGNELTKEMLKNVSSK